MSKIRIHIIQHSPTLPAAAYLDWVARRGHELTLTKPYAGDPLPTDPAEHDLLILTGGPQTLERQEGDTMGLDFPAELDLIRAHMDRGNMVVGTCLGAQMISYALDGDLGMSPEREIGCFPLDLTEEGKNDPLWQDFPDHLEVGHWHRNMPSLPPGAVVLAETAGCPRQILRYAPLVYGIQPHLEFTPASVAHLLSTIPKELPADRHPFVWTKRRFLDYTGYPAMNRALMGFLDRLTERFLEGKAEREAL